ncbi:phage tail sheath subtilisin-like domain-containing protein [Dethiosulfatarculus sandiegensis]|uniref:Tail protein n=1 Tax=Dethiosulfatarculus sandiegensis TaxID=1429043 RepID=A0A0D2JXD0_9BACT|nr:phage tail sheath subtilisin-like domain-containing protein [Dethiosulfatarculus sandiegensis]KIX14250.1 tail protein [Dethiosulfatarculus sandiegensis]
MAISFNQIPVDLRTPGQYVEFDNSRALHGLLGIHQRLLVIGQRTASAEVEAGRLVMAVTPEKIKKMFGQGSMLTSMLLAAKEANPYTETWAVALDDDDAAVAAKGSVTLSGDPAQSGTLNLYLGGERIRILVQDTETPEEAAANLAAEINLHTELPVTALVDDTDTNKVNITARHKGEAGNHIDIRINYFMGDSLPEGLGVTISPMKDGTANPSIATALAALAEEQFNYIAMPYTDNSNLNLLASELEGRWGPMRQIEGLAFTAAKGTTAELSTLGDARNDKLISMLGTGKSPTQPEIWAAVYAATAAFYLNIDPARPLQTLELIGVLPPSFGDRFTREERNVLLHKGVSTCMVDADGRCRIERSISTYQENAYGYEDPSYLDMNTMATLAYIRIQVRARIAQVFGRHKLANDETTIWPGQAIARPKDVRMELIALFLAMEEQGIVESVDQWADQIVVEIDGTDSNRVNALLPPDLINQLRVFASQVQFRL